MAEKSQVLASLRDKYYGNWNQYKILGVTIDIIPLPDDIPVLESYGYNPLIDTFSIKFKTERERKEIALDDTVSIFQDDKGYVTGVSINGVKQKGIKEIKVTIKKTLEDYISAMRNKLGSLTDRVEAYRELGRFDPNQRAVNFLEELTEKNLDKMSV